MDGIFINEIMADNNSFLSDENGKFAPWIEIYNDEIIPVDLSGSYLTNDINSPSLWEIPENTIIKPKSYLIIWADNDPSAGELHTSFRLDKSGGEIAIFSPDSELLDSFTYGEQSGDISYGRSKDGQAELAEAASVTLIMYDIYGSIIKSLVDEMQSAGKQQAVFDGSGLVADVYYYTLRVGGSS